MAKDPEHSNWVQRHPVMSVAAGVPTGAIATQQGLKHRRLIKHQYEWERPNGEKGRVRGFNEKQVREQVAPVLSKYDSQLHSHVKLGSVDIKKQSSLFGKAEGMAKPSNRKGYEVAADPNGPIQGFYKKLGVSDKLIDKHVTQKAQKKLARMDAKPKAKDERIKVRISPKAVNRGRARGVIAHEMAHAMDFQNAPDDQLTHTHGHHREHAKSTNGHWTRADYERAPIESSLKFAREGIPISHREGAPKAYQATHPVEDLAESVRAHLGEREGLDHEVNLDKGRTEYLHKHFFKPSDTQKPMEDYAAKITRKAGMHNHFDKFAIAGAGAAAAGAAYHHHKEQQEKSLPYYNRKQNSKIQRVKNPNFNKSRTK